MNLSKFKKIKKFRIEFNYENVEKVFKHLYYVTWSNGEMTLESEFE
jgi:ssDNA-specific exonuclease RecJ